MKKFSGPPLRTRVIDNQGFMTLPWAMFLQSNVRPPMLIGSHPERINSFLAELQTPGSTFYEYDRNALYMLFDMASPVTTVVDQDSAVGTAILYVSATQGFQIGQAVYIGQGTAREELGAIAVIAPGVSVTLAANLANTHTAAQADRVTSSPKTSVDANSAAGTPTLNVASTLGFATGDTVLIGESTPRQERGVISAITAGVSFTMTANLAFTHTAAQADRVGLSAQWAYLHGQHEATLANIPTDLGPLDGGFLFRATNYDRIWRWSGAAWERAPGEFPTLFVGLFCTAPGTGWKLLDGTGNPFTYTLADGTTTTITIQDARGHYPKMAAAFTGNQVAASAPGLSGSTASGTAVIGAPSATQVVQAGGGVTVATFDHNHTDSGHTHAVGTVAADATGEPAHMDFLPYVKL